MISNQGFESPAKTVPCRKGTPPSLRNHWGLAVLALLLILPSFALLRLGLGRFHAYAEQERRAALAEKVSMARHALTPILSELREGRATREEALASARERLRTLCFEDEYGPNYIFLNGLDSRVILRPYQTEDEGRLDLRTRDARGALLLPGVAARLRARPGGVFESYPFPNPKTRQMDEKLSYFEAVPELDAMIGTGAYMNAASRAQLGLLCDGFLLYLAMFLLFGVLMALALGALRIRNLGMGREMQERLRAEEALRRSEAMLKAIVGSAPVGIASIKNRRFIEVNEAFARIFQRERAEFRGQSARLTYASDAAFEAADRTLYGTPGPEGAVETLAQRSDGTCIPMLVCVAPLELEGTEGEYVTIIMDITRQKENEAALKASEAMLKLVLDTIPQAVFWKNSDGIYLGCNGSFARAAGLEHSSGIVGWNDFEMPWGPEHAEAYRSVDKTVLDSRQPKRHIIESFRDAKGRKLWLDTTKVPLENEQGEVIGLLGCFEDITERKQVEDALAQSRLFTDAVMESVPGLLFVYDVDGHLVRWNQRNEEMMGYSAEELKRFRISDWCKGDPEGGKRIEATFQRAFREGHAEVEAHIILRSGQRIPYYFTALSVDIGGAHYLVGVGLDMTEQRKAEAEMRQHQQRFQTIFEASPFSITLNDPETGIYCDVNQRFCEVIGCDKTSILGKTAGQLGLSVEEGAYRNAMQILKRDGFIDAMEIPMTMPGVGDRNILATVRTVSMGDKPFLLFMAVDITEWKRSERAIQESERELRTLFEDSPIGIFRSTLEGRFLQVNPAFAAMLRYEEPFSMVEEVNRRGISEGLYESADQRTELLRKLQANTGMWFVEEVHFRRKDCTYLDGIMSIILHLDLGTGQPTLCGFVQDISERKKGERENLLLKNYLSNVIDSMPSALVGLDEKGRVTQWNRAAEDLLGVPEAEALGHPLGELTRDFAPWIETLRQEVQQEKRPASMEKLLLERGNERQFFELMLYPLVADGMEGAVVHIQDITARVRIQELMIQTEKMMSVGGLAAGMAHEINNPLGIISQSAQNIERRLSLDLPANHRAAQEIGLDMQLLQAYFERRQISQFLGGIREAVTRATRIVSNMLKFSRQSESARHPASLPEIAEQALELAANDYDLKKKFDFRSIEILREFDPELPLVPVVAIEIEQVLLNLLRNAAQAMAANPSGRQPRLTLRIRREAKHAVLEVEDNGPGMDEAVRRRVFEPFFTTKEPGVGTGLGLSVSYTIITQNHKGLMEVASNPGWGTCFTVRLPMMKEREDA